MKTIPAKTILGTVRDNSAWFGTDYNINLYKGCCHGCIYCDSRSSCYRIENFDTVRAKENALQILERELRSRRKTGVVGMGSMSDTYNPFEKKLELTRQALFLFEKYNFGCSVETKSDLIQRDADILSRISSKNDVIVKITITAFDDILAKQIEPRVCDSSRRFAAIRHLAKEGIFCGILLTPLLPYITDNKENLLHIIRAAHENGARFVCSYGLGVTLRENQRDYYYEKLDVLFPGLKERYRKRYGETYSCVSPNAKQLAYVMANECEKLGLLHSMPDITIAYKQHNRPLEQMSLF